MRVCVCVCMYVFARITCGQLSGQSFVLDVNLIQYENPDGVRTTKQCCDVDPETGECVPPCDLSIRICLRVGKHSTDKGNRACDWNSVDPRVVNTDVISADFIVFNNTVGGVSNPIVFSFSELPEVRRYCSNNLSFHN